MRECSEYLKFDSTKLVQKSFQILESRAKSNIILMKIWWEPPPQKETILSSCNPSYSGLLTFRNETHQMVKCNNIFFIHKPVYIQFTICKTKNTRIFLACDVPSSHIDSDGPHFRFGGQDNEFFCSNGSKDLISVFQSNHLLLRDLCYLCATFAVSKLALF